MEVAIIIIVLLAIGVVAVIGAVTYLVVWLIRLWIRPKADNLCPRCGRIVRSHTLFCVRCGLRLPEQSLR